MRCLGAAGFSVLLLMAAGCGSTMGPRLPRELSAPSLLIYSQADFKRDADAYHAAIQSKDLAGAQALRNQIAYRVMADVESGYGQFEMRLTSQRATFETASDAIQLGITAATTVVGVGDVKDILAASLSAFQGTRLSYDKNWYREKTTEALLSQMRATRKTKQAQLILSLGTRDVVSYPLEAAWIDLVDFYYAGTVPSALVEIATTAGADAKVGAGKLNDAIAQMTPVKQSISNRTAYERLKAALAGTDDAKKDSAIKALHSILIDTGYSPDANATGEELLRLLRKAMSDTDPDIDTKGEKLKALSAAVAAANVQ